MIVDVFLASRARVGDRNRADFQSFARKTARNFDHKTAQVRCRKCAQRTANARRVNAHALHVVWRLPVAIAKLLQALGACRAQKSRRISSKFSRFSPTIASFCRRMSCKKQRRAQQNLQGLCNVHQTILDIFLTQRACVGGRTRAEFQIFCMQNRANFTRKRGNKKMGCAKS